MLDTSGGYSVRDIEGLDPVDAVLTSSSMAQVDGATPQNARRDIRNITMKLGLVPDYVANTVQSLRSDLYKYLLPKTNITLAFYIDGALSLVGSGQVETLSNVMFSDDPEVDVSIVCYDPDFYTPAPTVLSLNTTSDTNTTLIDYEGTSEAGVIFTLNINRTLTEFTIYSTTPDNTVQKFDVNGAYLTGDVIVVNTIPGQKGVTLTRGALSTPIMYDVDPLAVWTSLERGGNAFRAYAAGAAIPYTLSYTEKFGGI
jgi:hypothetical protein